MPHSFSIAMVRRRAATESSAPPRPKSRITGKGSRFEAPCALRINCSSRFLISLVFISPGYGVAGQGFPKRYELGQFAQMAIVAGGESFGGVGPMAGQAS